MSNFREMTSQSGSGMGVQKILKESLKSHSRNLKVAY